MDLSAQERNEGLDIPAALGALRRWLWLIGLIMVAAIAASHLYLRSRTPLYTARAEVLLEETKSPIDLGGLLGMDQLTNSVVQTEIEILSSQTVMDMTVRRMKLIDDPELNPPPAEDGAVRGALQGLKELLGRKKPEAAPLSEEGRLRKAMESLRARIRATSVRPASILRVEATSSSAKKAAELANAVVQSYLELRIRNRLQKQTFALDFITRRVEDLRKEVETAEAAVQAFRSEKGILTESPPEAALFEDLNARYGVARNLTASLEERVALLEAALREGPVRNGAEMLESLRFTGYPPQISPDDARLYVERALKGALDDLDGARKREAALASSRAEIQAKLRENAANLVTLGQLSREAAASKALLGNFLTRQKETTAQQDLLLSPDARILTQARPPITPSYPKRNTIYMFGGLSGLATALGLVFLLEKMRYRFTGSDELELYTRRPILGVVPFDRKSTKRSEILRRVIAAPGGRMIESARNLRTSILLAELKKPPQIILVTSSIPSEGKSLISVLLAVSGAQMSGKRALIIDADLRRRTLHETLEQPAQPGLLALLSGRATLEEATRVDRDTGLYAICVEENHLNAADLLSSKSFQTLLESLRERYDMIVLDAPPILPVSDARILCKMADAVVYVVRWNYTPRDAVRQGLALIDSVNAPLAGLVLSQVDYNALAYGDGKYYIKDDSYYKE